MRFIDTSNFAPSSAWLQTARVHQLTINNLTPDDRSAHYDVSANKHWNETAFKNSLLNIGNRKCWYSEANRETSLFVDHFRPKSRVYRIKNTYAYNEGGTRPNHEGYFWLAYEYANFRIGCWETNNKKSTFFPLETATNSVDNPVPGDVTVESNMFLDPCVKADVCLLGYNLTIAVPTCDKAHDLHNYHRAKMSITAYALNDEFLDGSRRRHFDRYIKTFIEAAKSFRANDEASFLKNATSLVMFLSPHEEFTAMIEHHLISVKDDWVEAYVLSEARRLGYIQ
jgi:hypothetical protein